MSQEPAVYPPFKDVFLYDPETCLFAAVYPAQLSPEDSPGTYLAPVCSTDIVPPAAGIEQVAQFVNGNWILIPDFRGQTWYDQNSGEAVEIIEAGQPASNLAATPPPPTLQAVIAMQTATLYQACAAAIVAGFTSSALGAPYTYPSQPNDQSNLVGAVTASLQPGLSSTWSVKFWCATQPAAPAFPVWAMVAHTPAQIQQVLADGVAAREAYSAKLDSLIAQLNQAATIAGAEAVTW